MHDRKLSKCYTCTYVPIRAVTWPDVFKCSFSLLWLKYIKLPAVHMYQNSTSDLCPKNTCTHFCWHTSSFSRCRSSQSSTCTIQYRCVPLNSDTYYITVYVFFACAWSLCYQYNATYNVYKLMYVHLCTVLSVLN